MTEQIKVIEPILNYIKEFKDPEEFDMYYKMNKEKMDSLTTHKLNKLYHIKDYRITKIKGVLMLKKDYKVKTDTTAERIDMLENEINEIKTTLNSIRAYFNHEFQNIE